MDSQGFEDLQSEQQLAPPEVPAYLRRYYWWTYIHPWAVKFFDHLWLVNLIVLTNYHGLREAALKALQPVVGGKTLQISCCYGDFSPKLAQRVVKANGLLDVIDVLPIQLANLKHKLPKTDRIRLFNRNAVQLGFGDGAYDTAVLFFLLHEVPLDVRAKVLEEAWRVVRPGGKLVLVDFSNPYWWNPFRYAWAIFLTIFEPFALNMWRTPIKDMLPEAAKGAKLSQKRRFGGLFQTVVVDKP